MEWLIIILVFGGAAVVGLFIWGIYESQEFEAEVQNMKSVSKQIVQDVSSKKEATIDDYIKKLGSGYMTELLKSGEIKYTWKKKSEGYSYSYKGTGMRDYISAKTYRISIYVKDGKITRTAGLNLED